MKSYVCSSRKKTRKIITAQPNDALPSMLKQGQGVNVKVRPDCMMRDFSNAAQWNKPTRLPRRAPNIEIRGAPSASPKSTPVSVDAFVTPER